MRIEYQDPSEASDAINDMLAKLADVRAANRALLAQLDEERASHAKSQEAYDNATAKLADQLAEARNTIYRWESHDFEDDVDDATAPILAELADARAQLAVVTADRDSAYQSLNAVRLAKDHVINEMQWKLAAFEAALADMTRRKDGWRGVAMEWRKRFKDIIEENQSEFLEFNEIVRYFRERKGDKE